MAVGNSGVLDGIRRIGAKVRDITIDGGIPGLPLGFRMRGATQYGPPLYGTYRAGDMAPGRAGNMWFCTGAGTPGSWAGAPPGLRLFYVDNYGADPTGATLSDNAFAEAYGAATAAIETPSAGPTAGALVMLGAGIYQFTPGVVKVSDCRIGLLGPGSQACTLFTTGSSGDLVYATDTSPGRTYTFGAAPVGGFQLYGWNSGAAVNGFHFGDRSYGNVRDVVAQGFNFDSTCTGLLFRNDNGGLCEGNLIQAAAAENTLNITLDGSNANGSFDYGNYFFGLVATGWNSTDAYGFQVINQGHMFGAFCRVQGNVINSHATHTLHSVVIGSSSSDTARINGTELAIALECDGSTGTVKDLEVTGASASSGIYDCGGAVTFLNASGSFTAGSVGGSAVVQGWGTWSGPLFSSVGTLNQVGLATGLVSYSSASGSPIAPIELPAGTASAAPLVFQSGTNLTTAAAGAAEFDGTAFYATAAASSRQVVDAEQLVALTSSYTLANSTAAQKIFNASTNGTLTVQAGTSYFFEIEFDVTGLSGSSHNVQFGFGGTATWTSMKYLADIVAPYTASTFASWTSAIITSTSAVTLFTAGTFTSAGFRARGILRVNAGGTVIPQITQVTASAAAVIGANSYFRIWPVGSNTVTNVGDWS